MDTLSNILNTVDHQHAYREAFKDLQSVVKNHVSATHITRTHADRSAGRIEATWNPSERRFSDPGNDVWLQYKYDLDLWQISVREHSHLGRDVAARALITKANTHAQYGRLSQMWYIYWMLILMSLTEYNDQIEDTLFDIHFSPFVEANYLSPAELDRDL